MCTINTNEIYLTWRKDIDKSRHVVGKLYKIDDSFFFQYIKENVELAIKEDGFTYYPPFLYIDEVYSENVLQTFQRRLLNPLRSDYNDFLNYWGALEYKDDVFSLLGLTGAKLLTDKFEFIAPHNEIPAKFNTDVSWLNTKSENLVNAIRSLSNSEVEPFISLDLDENNLFDTKAVRVLFKNETLGYLKSIHCANVHDAIINNKDVKVKIANIIKNGTIKEVLLRIEIN